MNAKRLFSIIAICLLTLPLIVSAQAPTKFVWTAPLTNADGSPLTDLAGFRVYQCPIDPCDLTNATLYGETNASTLEIPIDPNTQGVAFATAFDTSGNESQESNAVPFDKLAPGAVLTFGVQ